MTIAALFPGQGTQTPGMGGPWRGHSAWKIVERAETVLGEDLGKLLLDAPAAQLSQTRNSQLAVLVTSLMAWEVVQDRVPAPVAFAGHSLGQVSALIASGALEFDDGVRFAASRAAATQAAADRYPGRMAALVGASIEQAEEACRAAPDACWVANDNAPGQVVVAGKPDGLDAALARARELGVRRSLPLDVNGAFHTPLMRDATHELADVVADVKFRAPAAPVVSNLDARARADGDWRKASAHHVSTSVRWRESLETLAAMRPTRFVEVGSSTMLAGLAKRTTPDVPTVSVGTPEQLEQRGRP